MASKSKLHLHLVIVSDLSSKAPKYYRVRLQIWTDIAGIRKWEFRTMGLGGRAAHIPAQLLQYHGSFFNFLLHFPNIYVCTCLIWLSNCMFCVGQWPNETFFIKRIMANFPNEYLYKYSYAFFVRNGLRLSTGKLTRIRWKQNQTKGACRLRTGMHPLQIVSKARLISPWWRPVVIRRRCGVDSINIYWLPASCVA